MIDQVHQMNAHLMISVWPKFYHTTEHFKELEKISGMYMQAVKDSVRDWVGKGYVGSFYDAYNDRSQEVYSGSRCMIISVVWALMPGGWMHLNRIFFPMQVWLIVKN